MRIRVGARSSPLSRVQVEEVQRECGFFFEPIFLETTGDLDQKSSLRDLDKSNFFTEQLDEMVLAGEVEIAIHSAKDLPDPLPEGLKIIAITRGVATHDTLLMRAGETLSTLKKGAKIATSTARRDEQLHKMRSDLEAVDIRGAVDKRVERLLSGEFDGLIVAEAALIRLGLSGDPRFYALPMPGFAAPLQGKLAIVARESRTDLEALFAPLDIRKKRCMTYVGSRAHIRTDFDGVIDHYLAICIQERTGCDFSSLQKATHLIFTSKNGARLFLDRIERTGDRVVIAVGRATADYLKERGCNVHFVAEKESQEGVIEVLEGLDLSSAHIFIPTSSGARPLLREFLEQNGVEHTILPLYDTLPNFDAPIPDMSCTNEFLFGSPSAFEAFLEIIGPIFGDRKISGIGPITEYAIDEWKKLIYFS